MSEPRQTTESRRYVTANLKQGHNRVAHGLQRLPEGWRIVDATGNPPRVYRHAWDVWTLELVSENECSVKVEVW